MPRRHSPAAPLRVAALLLGLAPLAASSAAAQQPALRAADSLMRAGHVFRAESLYYVAVRREPRSPEARLALGRYLAARGALKVGAVLMEEARFFGGDPATVARELAPVYARLGDWRSLAILPATPLGPAERQRAEWLRASPPSHLGPDSTVVTLSTVPDAVGRLTIVIGGEEVEAIVDPSARGLVLDSAWRRRPGIRTFGTAGTVAVVPTLRIGQLTLTNVATSLGATGGTRRARVGLDLLAPFNPTFDVPGSRAILRRGGRPPQRGERVPTLVLPTGVWLVRQGTVVPMAGEAGRAVTAQLPWTLLARRGEIVVGR